MSYSFHFDAINLSPETETLRQEVRSFIGEHRPTDLPASSDFGNGGDAAVSRALGKRGWIGMTWPKRYGGGERSFLDRYVVTEELLAAGMPVSHHWIADRQSGPLLLKFGTEAQCEQYLPAITRGEVFFSIGMSEPDSGSDLASVRTTAVQTTNGFVVNGTKLWTSGAHHNHYMIALVRTQPDSERHQGLSQLIIDLKSPDIQIRPIKDMAGASGFDEVVMTDLFVPGTQLIGELHQGWQQVTSELAYERSGPERFLSSFRVLVELIRSAKGGADDRLAIVIGRLAAQLITLRKMSISVAGMLEAGGNPALEAALVKELGNRFEKQLPELARLVVDLETNPLFKRTLADTLLHMPSFSIRGGTREILRSIIARGLGLR